jgi:hypothetical protein
MTVEVIGVKVPGAPITNSVMARPSEAATMSVSTWTATIFTRLMLTGQPNASHSEAQR